MRTFDPRDAATLFPVDSWFKATASNDNGTGCVEVNFGTGELVGLRDSKHPQGAAFVFTASEWRALLNTVLSNARHD